MGKYICGKMKNVKIEQKRFLYNAIKKNKTSLIFDFDFAFPVKHLLCALIFKTQKIRYICLML